MDIFKKASQQKLRFNHAKGSLSVEQLWDLNLEDLDVLAVGLEEQVEKSAAKSFLTETSSANKVAKLRFEISLAVLQTKVANRDRALLAADTRKKRQRIAELIATKQDESLADKSIEELEALMAE